MTKDSAYFNAADVQEVTGCMQACEYFDFRQRTIRISDDTAIKNMLAIFSFDESFSADTLDVDWPDTNVMGLEVYMANSEYEVLKNAYLPILISTRTVYFSYSYDFKSVCFWSRPRLVETFYFNRTRTRYIDLFF